MPVETQRGREQSRVCSSYAAGKHPFVGLLAEPGPQSDVRTATKCLFLALCLLHPRYHLSFVPPSKTGPRGSDGRLRKGEQERRASSQTYFKHIL